METSLVLVPAQVRLGTTYSVSIRDIDTECPCQLTQTRRFQNSRRYFRNLTLLANVYWTEFMSPDAVFSGWGGAYELVFQDGNRNFLFLEDYSIFLRVFDVDRVSEGIRPWTVLKYERRSEVSVVTMALPDRLEFFGARDILASDEPLKYSVGGDSFTMNSKVHVSIVAVCKGTRFLAPMIQIEGVAPQSEAKKPYSLISTSLEECAYISKRGEKTG